MQLYADALFDYFYLPCFYGHLAQLLIMLGFRTRNSAGEKKASVVYRLPRRQIL